MSCAVDSFVGNLRAVLNDENCDALNPVISLLKNLSSSSSRSMFARLFFYYEDELERSIEDALLNKDYPALDAFNRDLDELRLLRGILDDAGFIGVIENDSEVF